MQVNAKPAAVKRPAEPKKHWTDEFFKHLDAWGEEMRRLAGHHARRSRCGTRCGGCDKKRQSL